MDDSLSILRKINAADSRPGVKCELSYNDFKNKYFVFGARNELLYVPKADILPG